MVDPKPVPVSLVQESGLSNQEQSLDWTFISQQSLVQVFPSQEQIENFSLFLGSWGKTQKSKAENKSNTNTEQEVAYQPANELLRIKAKLAFSTGTQSCFHRLSLCYASSSLLRARHLRANSFHVQQHSLGFSLKIHSHRQGAGNQ